MKDIKRRIAIIGGGAAGTAAAWALRSSHDVTLFEAESQLGGHAQTVQVNCNGQPVDADLGVEYFNERVAPNFCELIDHLGLETYVAPLSMRVMGKQGSWSNASVRGDLRQRLERELDRFHADMIHVLQSGEARFKAMSLRDFTTERQYSQLFVTHALQPLLTTFSGARAPSLDYNLMYCVLSFNMGLLSFFTPGYWRKIKGGVGQFYARMTRELGRRVRTRSVVRAVVRNGSRWQVSTHSGATEQFDEIVFATHADVTLRLLEAPSAAQRELLSGYEYVPIVSVLHHDATVLGERALPTEYCHFRLAQEASAATPSHIAQGTLTRIVNSLAPYRDVPKPVLVSFDPVHPIREDLIVTQRSWKLPKLRPQDLQRRMHLRAIQGHEGLWFCGTDTSLTGHEGAIVSGLVIADALGAGYPFSDDSLAAIQFKMVKGLMGVMTRRERFLSRVNDTIFQLSMRLQMQKQHSHRLLLNLIS